MVRGLGTATWIIIIMAIIILGVSAVDFYRDHHMKNNAMECGFTFRGGASRECKCAGSMVDSGSLMNPLFRKAGEIRYYCYGECVRCACYQSAYSRRYGNMTKTEIDCSDIVEANG